MSCEPIMFEALCTPPPSLGAGGLRVVAAILLGFSAAVGIGCVWFGAWPVLGFFGAEAGLVVWLLARHRRRSTRPPETIRLIGDALLAGGASLAAYWTRIELREEARGPTRLLLRDRDRVVEVGQALGEPAKRELAHALRAALGAYREPRFRNPQLEPLSRPARDS